MSYRSYFEVELQYAPQYLSIKEEVLELLEIVSGQGHSGGSMSIFGPYYKKWSENPTPITDENSLLKPIWEAVKNLSEDKRKEVLWVASRISTYTPLTHLTGESSEWMEVYRSETETTYQNRRLSSIFKTDKASPYWLDGTIFYEPNAQYTDYYGFTSSDSRRPISFPFDPETKPEKIFFKDTERKHRVEEDPNSWLSFARDLFNRGFDPITGKTVLDAHFLNTVEEFEAFKTFFYSFLNAIEKLSDEELGIAIGDLLYFHPTNGYFEYSNYNKNVILRTSSYSHIRNTLRLLESSHIKEIINKYRNDSTLSLTQLFNDDLTIDLTIVFEPEKNYQEWIESTLITPVITRKTDVIDIPYFDTKERTFIDKDHYKYLYKKCKELCLEYKGKRN